MRRSTKPKFSAAVLQKLGATGVQGVTAGAARSHLLILRRTFTATHRRRFQPSAGEDDEKILAKLDWNINDNHRLALTYNYINGFNQTGVRPTIPDEYESFDHYYVRSTKLQILFRPDLLRLDG